MRTLADQRQWNLRDRTAYCRETARPSPLLAERSSVGRSYSRSSSPEGTRLPSNASPGDSSAKPFEGVFGMLPESSACFRRQASLRPWRRSRVSESHGKLGGGSTSYWLLWMSAHTASVAY